MSFRTTFFSCIILVLCLFNTGPTLAQDIRYEVSFEQAQSHYVHIRMKLTAAEENQEIFLPVWTPGSYLVREYARHIDSVSVKNPDGDEVPIKKISKNRWRIESEDTQDLDVHYRIYCNELTVRTNFVDSEFALLNGAATFMTVDGRLDKKHFVHLEMPSGWKQSVSAMNRPEENPAHSFVASSFDELVDSPIVVGNPDIFPFEVGGVTHYLVNQGGDGLWDGGKAAADVAKIVAEHQRMWGVVPYKKYLFLNVIAESGGGLEHDNSTVMLTSRWSFRSKSSYARWLGLVSHEFFHTWNVRRLRPRALVNYDYENENYFDELWVAEGVTSYYDDLALVRSQHTSATEYLSALSKQINTLETTEGRFKQSLTESSHDAWIKYYRPDENSRNTSISYYNKGALVAFLLDIEVRRATDNAKSLDDVMRGLYNDFALGEGFTNAEVLAAVNAATGGDYAEWLQGNVELAENLDYSSALEWLGLEFEHLRKADKPSTQEATWLGASTKVDDGKLMVSAITENSPAFEAGLNVDDEIIALNGYRVSGDLTGRLKQFLDQTDAKLTIARRGKLAEISVLPAVKAISQWKLKRVAEPSDAQTKNWKLWLHLPDEKKETP